MALITATTALELDPGSVDLGGYFAPGKQVSLHDNLNYASPQGRIYQDVIDVVAPKDASWHDWSGGSGIVFDPTTHALTGETFTGVVAGALCQIRPRRSMSAELPSALTTRSRQSRD